MKTDKGPDPIPALNAGQTRSSTKERHDDQAKQASLGFMWEQPCAGEGFSAVMGAADSCATIAAREAMS